MRWAQVPFTGSASGNSSGRKLVGEGKVVHVLECVCVY